MLPSILVSLTKLLSLTELRGSNTIQSKKLIFGIYSIRGGDNTPVELHPNYTTRRSTTSRRNVIFIDSQEKNPYRFECECRHENKIPRNRFTNKPLIQIIREYSQRLLRESPTLYYGALSSLCLFVVWQIQPFRPFLQRHFVCSLNNIRSGRIHTLLSSVVSHASFGHLILNMYAFILFGMSLRRTKWILQRNSFERLSLLPFCLGAAITGNVAHMLSSHIAHVDANGCIGGSAVTLAMLALDAKLNPMKEIGFVIYLIPVRLPAQYASTILLVISLLGVLGVSVGSASISHASHLGGLLFGILYYDTLSNKGRIMFDVDKWNISRGWFATSTSKIGK